MTLIAILSNIKEVDSLFLCIQMFNDSFMPEKYVTIVNHVIFHVV